MFADAALAARIDPRRGAHVRAGRRGHRRLADAADAGCTLAVVTTGPGTRSQDNVMRRGFELLYARAILIRGT